MNIKRAFIVLAALTLLPAAAFAQSPVTLAPNTAAIAVQKIFDDGNNETGVTFTIKCTSGTIAPDTVTYTPGDGAFHAFIIADIPDGPANVCTVEETPIAGYDASALCYGDGQPNEDCWESAKNKDRLSFCQFDDVHTGDIGYCTINNAPTPVKVEVTKKWDVSNLTGGTQVNTSADISVFCNSNIVDKDGNEGGWRYKDFYLGANDYEDGEATVSVWVVPGWYPTAAKAKDQEYTECYAEEYGSDSSVEVTSNCGDRDYPGMEVAVGMGASCTITNTVFFEGIPTLNQYGLAIMALLMLGVGFVGFRRFA